MTFLSEGIKKLRAVYAQNVRKRAAKTTVLWRGMRNLRVSDAFMEERRGGTELAPMSTTKDLKVRLHQHRA